MTLDEIKQGVLLSLRINLVIAFLILIFLFVAVFIEPNRLVTTQNDFDLFGGQDGTVKIVFISDIHVISQEPGYLEDVVGKINEQKPDLILIGGDVIEARESELDRLSALEDLKAPYGIYSVLGNHDYGVWGCPTDPSLGDKVESKLESMNITVLRNENTVLDINGERFALIGLDDKWVCRNDYQNASRGIDALIPKIILAHNQISVEPSEIEGKSLILSGHTHCGQVRLPFITQAIMELPFGHVLGGRERLDDDTEIYVTCGITRGVMRFLSNPEISVMNVR